MFFQPEFLIPIVAILTIFLGVPAIVFYGILRIKRENRDRIESGGTMGLRELEERIEHAVRSANEPLRKQIASLEQRVERMDDTRRLDASTHEERLLAPPRE